MPDSKKKKQTVKGKPHQTSDMVGLPPEIVKQQEKEKKVASSGARYSKDSRGKYSSSSTPLKQQTMKTPTSKMKGASTGAKPTSPAMQKKDMMGKKMAPTKMKKC
jgi:hypothetical protein